MDAIRAFALLLGIALHAGLPFVVGLDASIWPIMNAQKSDVLTVGSFVIHVFRMSVFFLVAGFLARSMLGRLGTTEFVRNRAKRILAPLVVFWVVCFVLIVIIAVWAMARANGGKLPDPMPASSLKNGLSFIHLWFLYILLWVYAAVLGLRVVIQSIDPRGKTQVWADTALHSVLSSTLGLAWLALPIAAALLLKSDWLANQGIPTPAYSLIPDPAPFFIYTFVFGLGWLLDRQRDLLNLIARRWWVNFAWGAITCVICLGLLASTGAQASNVAPSFTTAMKLAYAAAYAVAVVGLSLAFVGAGMRFVNHASPKLRYLADASYWMYIAHLPVVMALQTLFMFAEWHWALKFAAINALSFAFLLVTYRYAVRKTWVGLLLSGKKHAV